MVQVPLAGIAFYDDKLPTPQGYKAVRTIRAIAKFARPRVTVMLFSLSFIGSAAGGEMNTRIALVFPLLVMWYIHATTINDYADYEIDKVNLRHANDRPLLESGLSKSALWKIHILSLAASVMLAIPFGTKAVLLMCGLLIIDYLYSLKPVRISDRGIAAQFLLAFAYVYSSLTFGYWSSSLEKPFPWLLSFGLFSAFVARLLLKDFRDVKGDRQHKKMTFLLRRGAKSTIRVSMGFWILATALVCIYVSFSYGVVIPLLVGLIQVAVLLNALGRTASWTKQSVIILFVAKAANAIILTLLAFLLSQNQEMLDPVERLFIPLILGSGLLIFNWFRYISLLSTVTRPSSAFKTT